MTDVQTEDKPAPFTPMSGKQMIEVFLLGAVVGVVVWGVSLLIDTYLLKGLICHSSTAGQCGSTSQYAEIAAVIIGAVGGLFGLVRIQAVRPLLVVIAAAISLWGITGMLAGLAWYGIGLASLLLYALTYTMFVWIARVRFFWLSVVLIIVFMAAIRLVLSV